ncbi:membrane protein [Bacillus phage YungSlug]|nr:membrane protein [Bacillus phage YungSlug]
MEILNHILETYAQFFDWQMWGEVLTSKEAWGLILSLVILEGLLSADNALVLAVMVKHLPEKQRKKALFYGLLGAYAFRFLFIGVGTLLIKIWWVKAIGAGYLAWLTIKYFIDKYKGESSEEEMNVQGAKLRGFWGTVVMVELMDIAFSVDSILAALGVSEQVWVLLIGGMLGILMMRGIAGVFLALIDRVPELETTAYILIAIIAGKMGLSIVGYEMSHMMFFLILVVAFAGTFVVHYMRKDKTVA